jgi:hypothetical protein
MWRRVTYAIVGVSLTACAATTTSSSRPFLANTRRDVITAAEIVASRVTDAYQAVVHLRPEFLRRRHVRPVVPAMHSSIPVYVDDLHFGESESLRYVPLERVRQIRYLNSTDADLRWGGSHPGGAILVTTLKK